MSEPRTRRSTPQPEPTPVTECRCPDGWPVQLAVAMEAGLATRWRHHLGFCGLPEDVAP